MSETPPKVSVVCAWYNRADYIRDTIDSLLAQDYPNFDVTVINDGSPDPRVREILDSYDDPRLRVVHQENTGFTVAIRRAIAMSTGEYIAIQGAGDVSFPQRLREQSAMMQADPKLAIVGCHYERHNLVTGRQNVFRPQAPAQGSLRCPLLSHGELMYRRTVYDEAGQYRTLFHVGQDGDLWMRMLRNHTAAIVPEVHYEQRHFADGVGMSAKKRETRYILDAVRIENENLFRKTGADYIDDYGAAAFAMLSGRWRVQKARLIVRLGLIELSLKLKAERMREIPKMLLKQIMGGRSNAAK